MSVHHSALTKISVILQNKKYLIRALLFVFLSWLEWLENSRRAIRACWASAITYCSIATISQPPTIRISHQCCIMEQITGLRIYCYSSEDAKCGCMSNKRESQPLDFPGNRTGKRQALYHKALTGASSFQFLLFCVCTLLQFHCHEIRLSGYSKSALFCRWWTSGDIS